MNPLNTKTTAELVGHLGAEDEEHMLRFVVGAIGSHSQFLDDQGGYWWRPDPHHPLWEFQPFDDNGPVEP